MPPARCQGATRLYRLNRAARPCEANTTYSFTRCLRNSVTNKLGCRFTWDAWASPAFPLCTKLTQLWNYEREHARRYAMQANQGHKEINNS